MSKYLTTQQVADMHGVDRTRIVRIARRRGIEPAAVRSEGRGRPAFLWTRAQASKLKPARRGRPSK